MSTATTQLDTDALRAAIERRDVEGQLAAYAPDAELTVVDAAHAPSTPLVVRGTDALRAHLSDVCERDMTHEVRTVVASGDHVAFEVACRYSSGQRVLCMCLTDVRDGRISRQRTVQAWDA